MLKLSKVIRGVLFLLVFCCSFYYFSEPERIENLNGWLQLLISGGVLTPLITYAWNLKSKFEKLIDNDGLNSVETGRLSKSISLFIQNIWLWMIFYILSGAVIFLFNVIKDDIEYSRYLGALSVSLLFVAFLSSISLRDFDVALSELKAAIIIRRKKNAERDAMLKLLNADDEFSQKEKDYFNHYNDDE
ncbi:hypothetical protein [Rahnella victoriana]|uniref:hypothetical protein n=1 Tax=Rahnella victoriana TaxID=1510570 RepID=UPI00103B40C4|nr:hypothetical protein [Rahnella victoriana]TBX34440.1 hypothetical protein EYY67_12345 [Rahnella victoriana]